MRVVKMRLLANKVRDGRNHRPSTSVLQKNLAEILRECRRKFWHLSCSCFLDSFCGLRLAQVIEMFLCNQLGGFESAVRLAAKAALFLEQLAPYTVEAMPKILAYSVFSSTLFFQSANPGQA